MFTAASDFEKERRMLQVIRKVLLMGLLCFLCSGCVWPRYHDKETYPVYVSDVLPGVFGDDSQKIMKTDALVTARGKGLSVQSVYNRPKPFPVRKHRQSDHAVVRIPRAWGDTKLVVQKPGFEPYTIFLKKQKTDEKWAQYALDDIMDEHSLSASYLPTFPNTWGLILFKEKVDLPSAIISWVIYLPFNVVTDVYNLLIGWPLTPILNPWYNFAYDNQPHLLTPTRQLQQSCHAQVRSLISNSGCNSCQNPNILYTTREECSRCPERRFDPQNSVCILPATFRYYGNP